MLIRALVDYYDILVSDKKLVGDEYSTVDIHWCVALTREGKLAGIVDMHKYTEYKDKNEKTKIKREATKMTFPKRTEFSGIKANIIEHRPLYIFGLDHDKKTDTFVVRTPEVSEAKAIRPMRSHKAFVEETLTFLEGLDSPIVNAFRSFVENWVPENETENPILQCIKKDYSTSYFAFCLEDSPGVLLNKDENVKKKWEELYRRSSTPDEEAADAPVTAMCAVTGEVAPIARLHGKLTGLAKGSSMGMLLVCCNNDSECSYGLQQSYNANIYEAAAAKYVKAANYLIHDPRHRVFIDDMTVIFWAMSEKETYTDFIKVMFENDAKDEIDREELDDLLASAYSRVSKGQSGVATADMPKELDPNVECYVAGLRPNSSRIAVSFVYHRRFGSIIDNLIQHQIDMQPYPKARSILLGNIKKELLSPKSTTETIDPSLMTKLMHSIINASPYPQALLAQTIRRVRIDHDEEGSPQVKINPTRIGIIKACINRQARYMGQKEEIQLYLDTKNTNKAYLCGRLFAVLEQIQKSASDNKLNRTIKDAYFASASTTPAVVFPKLLTLGQYHLKKANDAVELDRTLSMILNMLGNEFPLQLSLVEQGKFIIGYYHQNSAMSYHKEETNNEDQ